VGIFELVLVSDAVRDLVAGNGAESLLRQHLHAAGMKTLIRNGMEKIEQGVTTPEELLRVVMVEDIVSLKERKNE
jgi:type II secretory ATPase GspE/PulE/Tfp pilus assembly ATPase PilB-like protein